jgi:hypothetical protein
MRDKNLIYKKLEFFFKEKFRETHFYIFPLKLYQMFALSGLVA